MSAPIRRLATALGARLRSARFDPRAVACGAALLFVAALAGFTLLGITAERAERVIAPVASLCRQSGAASAELSHAGACAAADQARTSGPYVITIAAEAEPEPVPGEPGAPGRPGADAPPGVAPGEPAPPPGAEPGAPVHPCAVDPQLCRGPEGPPGRDGADGRDGAPVASQTFALPDGRILTCARTGGTDLDPMYRCQGSGSVAVDEPTATADEPAPESDEPTEAPTAEAPTTAPTESPE